MLCSHLTIIDNLSQSYRLSANKDMIRTQDIQKPSVILGEQDSRSLSIGPCTLDGTSRLNGPYPQQGRFSPTLEKKGAGNLRTPPPSTTKDGRYAESNGKAWVRNSSPAYNVPSSSTTFSIRHAPATPRAPRPLWVEADVPNTPTRYNVKRAVPMLEYRKECDPTYDPMRDPEHMIHRGCDTPKPSTERKTVLSGGMHGTTSNRDEHLGFKQGVWSFTAGFGI